MKKNIEQERSKAVEQFCAGKDPESICSSLGRARSWLYKWVARHTPDDPAWCESQSRRPHASPFRTPAEVEDIVEMVRLSLYNKGLFCGDQAIRWEPEEMGVQPLPSLSTIRRILCRHDLTHRRTGRYEPKGKAYPHFHRAYPITPIRLI